jgi:hypothetical protein
VQLYGIRPDLFTALNKSVVFAFITYNSILRTLRNLWFYGSNGPQNWRIGCAINSIVRPFYRKPIVLIALVPLSLLDAIWAERRKKYSGIRASKSINQEHDQLEGETNCRQKNFITQWMENASYVSNIWVTKKVLSGLRSLIIFMKFRLREGKLMRLRLRLSPLSWGLCSARFKYLFMLTRPRLQQEQ